MRAKLPRSGWILLMFGVAASGCHKQEKNETERPQAVQLVPEAERSRHFEAVNSQLELGGTLYGYADIDGDALKVASGIKQLTDQIVATQPMLGAFLDRDYGALFTELGLNDVKAIGFSSVAQAGGGFRNRAFFYTPAGRQGLLAVVGGPPAPFAYTRLAPPDADFFCEGEVDVPAAYAAVKNVVAKVAGQPMADAFEAQLRQAGASAGISVLDVIQGLKGRNASVLRLDPEHTFTIPGRQPFNLPAFSWLLRVDGVGPAVEGALAKLPQLAASVEGNRHFYSLKAPLPIAGLQPVAAVEGSTLYIATTREFLDECLQRSSGLEQNPDFKQALAAVGTEGNGLVYVTPRFFARLHQLGALNPQLTPQNKQVLDLIAARLPVAQQPLIAVRINRPDGILVRSFWNRSLKQDVAMMAMYNPVSVGLLAAMAIPAFQKVRQASQQKAIVNNLRMFAAAAQQYMLETGSDHATYADIVGPGKYIKHITPVAGEDYTNLVVHVSDTELSVKTADGRVVNYRL